MRNQLKYALLLTIGMALFCVWPSPTKGGTKVTTEKSRKPGLYAVFDTSMGSFVVELFPDKAPNTVKNFIDLAKGKKAFKDPKTGKMVTRPFYDGLVFHRVIPNFMIQGGDPLGNGTGGPGYQFEDEFDNHPGFSKPGYLAMANSGSNTNGSQFFITVVPTPWLNPPKGRPGGHTIFGEVIENYEVVDNISKVKMDGNNRPLTPVVINSISIEQ